MDGERFDALARVLGSGVGRRRILVGLFNGIAASLLGSRQVSARPPRHERQRRRRGGARRDDRSERRDLVTSEKKKPPKKCKPPKKKCGKACVDITKDVRHCGGCNRACGEGQSCVAKTCKDASGNGAITCPVCGECQTCVLGGDGCEEGCNDACLSRVLCKRANTDVGFRRLASYLASNGFASSSLPGALDVENEDGHLRLALATTYQHGARPAESAVLWYIEEATGEAGGFVVVHLDGVPDHALVVGNDDVERLEFVEAPVSGKRVHAESAGEWLTKCGVCEGLCSIGLDDPCNLAVGAVCGLIFRGKALLGCEAAVKFICDRATGDTCEATCRRSFCCGLPCEGKSDCCNGKCGLCGGRCCEHQNQCLRCVGDACVTSCEPPAFCGRTPSGARECQCPSIAYQRCPDPLGEGTTKCCDVRPPDCLKCQNGVCVPKCKPPKTVCRGELIPTCYCPENTVECGDDCCESGEFCCEKTETCYPTNRPCLCPIDGDPGWDRVVGGKLTIEGSIEVQSQDSWGRETWTGDADLVCQWGPDPESDPNRPSMGEVLSCFHTAAKGHIIELDEAAGCARGRVYRGDGEAAVFIRQYANGAWRMQAFIANIPCESRSCHCTRSVCIPEETSCAFDGGEDMGTSYDAPNLAPATAGVVNIVDNTRGIQTIRFTPRFCEP